MPNPNPNRLRRRNWAGLCTVTKEMQLEDAGTQNDPYRALPRNTLFLHSDASNEVRTEIPACGDPATQLILPLTIAPCFHLSIIVRVTGTGSFFFLCNPLGNVSLSSPPSSSVSLASCTRYKRTNLGQGIEITGTPLLRSASFHLQHVWQGVELLFLLLRAVRVTEV